MKYCFLQFRLYKGCYQLMAGANPMQAQAMLNSTSRASFLRKRGSGKVGLHVVCGWVCMWVAEAVSVYVGVYGYGYVCV